MLWQVPTSRQNVGWLVSSLQMKNCIFANKTMSALPNRGSTLASSFEALSTSQLISDGCLFWRVSACIRLKLCSSRCGLPYPQIQASKSGWSWNPNNIGSLNSIWSIHGTGGHHASCTSISLRAHPKSVTDCIMWSHWIEDFIGRSHMDVGDVVFPSQGGQS